MNYGERSANLCRESERKRERKIEMEEKVTQQENNCSLIQLSWSIARGDNIHRSRWCCCFDKNLRSLWQFDFIAHCTMYFYFVAYLELLSGRARARTPLTHNWYVQSCTSQKQKTKCNHTTILYTYNAFFCYMLHVFRIVLPEQILNAIAHVYIDCLGFFWKILRSLLYFVRATKKKCVSIFLSLLHFRAKNFQCEIHWKLLCDDLFVCFFFISVKLFTEFEYFIRIKGEQKMIDHLV